MARLAFVQRATSVRHQASLVRATMGRTFVDGVVDLAAEA